MEKDKSGGVGKLSWGVVNGTKALREQKDACLNQSRGRAVPSLTGCLCARRASVKAGGRYVCGGNPPEERERDEPGGTASF